MQRIFLARRARRIGAAQGSRNFYPQKLMFHHYQQEAA
jgi:hypothetical protein